MKLKAYFLLRDQGQDQVWRGSRTEQVDVSKASCTAQKSSSSYSPDCWSLAQLERDLMVTTSAAPVGMLEPLRSAIVAAKTRATVTRTTRAPGKLTVQRFAASLAGAAAVFCFSVAALILIFFCLVQAWFTAVGFFSFGSDFSASSPASAFTFASAFAFNSFAASSDSLLWLMKTLGMVNVTPLLLAWTSSSCKAGRGLTKRNAA